VIVIIDRLGMPMNVKRQGLQSIHTPVDVWWADDPDCTLIGRASYIQRNDGAPFIFPDPAGPTMRDWYCPIPNGSHAVYVYSGQRQELLYDFHVPNKCEVITITAAASIDIDPSIGHESTPDFTLEGFFDGKHFVVTDVLLPPWGLAGNFITRWWWLIRLTSHDRNNFLQFSLAEYCPATVTGAFINDVALTLTGMLAQPIMASLPASHPSAGLVRWSNRVVPDDLAWSFTLLSMNGKWDDDYRIDLAREVPLESMADYTRQGLRAALHVRKDILPKSSTNPYVARVLRVMSLDQDEIEYDAPFPLLH